MTGAVGCCVQTMHEQTILVMDAAEEPKALVLLTAFSSFPGMQANPTEKLLSWITAREPLEREQDLALHTSLARVTVLPVSAQDVDSWIQQSLPKVNNHDGPVMLLHMGVDSKAKRFKLERCAYNEGSFRVPDVRGWQPQGTCIDECEALGSCHTTIVDVDSVAEELCVRGFDVEVSTDPGRYICNWMYYRSLRCAQAMHAPATHHTQYLMQPQLQLHAQLLQQQQTQPRIMGPPSHMVLTCVSSPAALDTTIISHPASAAFASGPVSAGAGANGSHAHPVGYPPSKRDVRAHSAELSSRLHSFLDQRRQGSTGALDPAHYAPNSWVADTGMRARVIARVGGMPGLTCLVPVPSHPTPPSLQPMGAQHRPQSGLVSAPFAPPRGHQGPQRKRVYSLFVHVPPFDVVPEEVQRAFLTHLLSVLLHQVEGRRVTAHCHGRLYSQ